MTKQSSIEALRQQLAQTKKSTEGQLKELLQKLESQRSKLPLEDHPIIDWGISVIQTRMRQRKQLMNLVQKNLDEKGTDLRRLKDNTDMTRIGELIKAELPKLIQEGCDLEYAEGVGQVVSRLKTHMKDNLGLDEEKLREVRRDVSTFCTNKSQRHEQKVADREIQDSEDIRLTKALASHYKSAATDFS